MRNKLVLMTLFILASGFSVFAQPQADSWTDKISWSFKVVKIDESHAEIVATAKLKEHWHVYSVNHDPAKAEFTGYPTSFKLSTSDKYRAIGKFKDGRAPKEHTDELGLSLFFEGAAVFKQKIEVLSDQPFDIKVDYDFQVCDENGCLFPPTQSATVKVKGFKPVSKEEQEDELTIKGDEASDKDGNKYVLHNEKWVKVPEGNSIAFFKEYLKLGGSYE